MAAAGTTFKDEIGRHKKQLLQLGDETVLLQQANSDRPFFALLSIPAAAEGVEPVESEVWHFYCAMGLENQHEWQQSLLARCYDFHGAVCILKAVHDLLGYQLRSSLLACTAGKNRTKAETHELMASFVTRLLDEHVPTVQDERSLRSKLNEVWSTGLVQSAVVATDLRQCMPFLRAVIPSEMYENLRTCLYIE